MKILAFGITREYIGKSEIILSDNTITTVSQLKNHLIGLYPELKSLNSLAIAVNEIYASDDVSLNTDDIIALIPPVSGG